MEDPAKLEAKRARSREYMRSKLQDPDYQAEHNARASAYYKTPRGRVVDRALKAHRRALKSHACPAWVDREAIEAIYEACPEYHHVDHISPLKGRHWRGEWKPGDSLLWLLELPDGAEDIFGNPISTRVSIGLHIPLNLMPLPDEVNLSKHNRAPQPGYMDWFGHSLVNGLHA
jgi:hypothetical protein